MAGQDVPGVERPRRAEPPTRHVGCWMSDVGGRQGRRERIGGISPIFRSGAAPCESSRTI
jgi:hypothetical protein